MCVCVSGHKRTSSYIVIANRAPCWPAWPAKRHKNGADTYKTKAVSTLGELSGTGDPNLDGKVKGPMDLIDRLARSDRVRQSIIRHAFRFFMGRNEMLTDSKTLIAADRAYIDNDGSFKAVVVSLLTSDSFMYRK